MLERENVRCIVDGYEVTLVDGGLSRPKGKDPLFRTMIIGCVNADLLSDTKVDGFQSLGCLIDPLDLAASPLYKASGAHYPTESLSMEV